MFRAYVGSLSSTKTLFAVIKIESQSRLGRPVFSNVKLNFGPGHGPVHFFYFNDLPKMIESDPYQFRRAILFVDELHMMIDARRASSGLNVDFTIFATQLAKLDCELVYTAQVLGSQIDVRVRELGDLFVFCERWVFKDGLWQPANLMPRKLRYPIASSGVAYLKVLGGMEIRECPYGFKVNPAYFKMYDTEQFMYLDRKKFLTGASLVDVKTLTSSQQRVGVAA